MDEGAFDEMVGDILDAWFKGVSVLEIDWQVAQTRALGRFVAPRAARWVSPVSYAWDGDLRVGLADDTQQTLTAFPPDRFIVAKCKTKSGSVLGGALLRPLVWWWCAANFSADWLLNFAQVFGLPLRWANYDATAPQETVDRICAMLQNMGNASWGAFPQWHDAGRSRLRGRRGGADTPQGDMLDRADKQCDLLVLGQTLTTDTGNMGHGGGSHALGRVHADVRSSIIDAAAKFAAGVIEQQLIPSICALNYGGHRGSPDADLPGAHRRRPHRPRPMDRHPGQRGRRWHHPVGLAGQDFRHSQAGGRRSDAGRAGKAAATHPPEEPFARRIGIPSCTSATKSAVSRIPQGARLALEDLPVKRWQPTVRAAMWTRTSRR